MTAFARYIGIDYSGAKTSIDSLKGLRVYLAGSNRQPVEVLPPPSPRKYWTRRGVAEWLLEWLIEDIPTLVGIDHGFSFPLRYFETHGLKPGWPTFLDDFQRHWPTDSERIWVRDVLRATRGNAARRRGDKTWFSLTEGQTPTAKSVFNFDQRQGCVAYSTHTGIPWLHFIRKKTRATSALLAL